MSTTKKSYQSTTSHKRYAVSAAWEKVVMPLKRRSARAMTRAKTTTAMSFRRISLFLAGGFSATIPSARSFSVTTGG